MKRKILEIRPVIWPDPDKPDDRIISQMAYGLPADATKKKKRILVYSGVRDGMNTGSSSFIAQKCPVTDCEITYSRADATTADLILWQDIVSLPNVPRPSGQIWMVC